MPDAKTRLGEARYATRLRMVKKLADEYGIIADNNSTAGEDLQDFLSEEEPYEFKRYCVVTQGSELYYLYPDFNNLGDAKFKAIVNINDSIYSEDAGEDRQPR
jgi:hypothetical protein